MYMRWEAVLMNLDKVYNSIEDVLEVAESAEGKTVGEFDINKRLDSKGWHWSDFRRRSF